mgnify:CR=1 FL=1
MFIEEADRLKELPPYLFAEIDRIINEKKSRGEDVISLGIGDPDISTPSEIIDELYREAKNQVNHRYPSSYGLMLFKEAVAEYYERRFNVKIEPSNEVIPLWGSKEGIANIAYAFINPGDIALIPDPGYLVYKIGTLFAGGSIYPLPLLEKNNFLIDLNNINKKVAKKAKLMHLNYPNNPTTADGNINFFKEVADFAEKNNILVCHDNAYSEVYFDENKKPLSFLNAENSKEVGIEFNSLSKTFNMTGWRIGYAVGNKKIIESLGKYKTNVDSGIFNAIQSAGALALKNYQKFVKQNISIYKRRREFVYKTLDKIGINYYKSNSTIYVWVKVPKSYNSTSFAELLLNKANVVVTPGNAFGNYGEGYIRISITLLDSRLEEALERIKKVL